MVKVLWIVFVFSVLLAVAESHKRKWEEEKQFDLDSMKKSFKKAMNSERKSKHTVNLVMDILQDILPKSSEPKVDRMLLQKRVIQWLYQNTRSDDTITKETLHKMKKEVNEKLFRRQKMKMVKKAFKGPSHEKNEKLFRRQKMFKKSFKKPSHEDIHENKKRRFHKHENIKRKSKPHGNKDHAENEIRH